MKKILFIATGGTIASKKTENGLTPQITPEELLSYIPEVEGLCEITAVNPFNLDSSNVVPENWSITRITTVSSSRTELIRWRTPRRRFPI